MDDDLTLVVSDPEAGTEQALEVPSGWSVMEILRDSGFAIKGECGGCLCCATCHVYVDPDWVERLSPPSEEELAMLDEAIALRDNSRLSCQIIMSEELNGLKLAVAPNDM